MSEARLLKQIQVAISEAGARVFRNNSALAWAGKVIKPTKIMTVIVGPGDVVIRDARPIHAGLGVGSSDLIGWTPCGKSQHPIARFTAIEVKTVGTRVSDEQAAFINAVNDAGGLGVIAYSVEDAIRGIRGAGDI